MTQESDPVAILTRLIEQRIVTIEQAFYVFNDAITQSDCLLQVRVESDFIIHFLGGVDGETVRIVDAPWEDPFVEPLSDENRAFVEQCGKWTLFDTSATPHMAPLVEHTIRSISLVHDQRGIRRGVELEIGSTLLTYLVDGDEGFVVHGPATAYEYGLFDVVPVAPRLG